MRKVKSKFALVLVLIFLFISVTISYADEDVVLDIYTPTINLTSLTITDSSVELVWTSQDNSIAAASYDLYRDDILIKNITSFTYTDIDLSPETCYTYYIKAKDSDGKEISDSNKLSVTTKAKTDISTLNPPINLTASEITDTSVKLTWDAETTTPSAIKFLVYENQIILKTTTEKSYLVENLDPETEYTFAVALQEVLVQR